MKKEEERSLAVDFDLDLDLDLLKERKQNDSPRRGLFLRFSSPHKIKPAAPVESSETISWIAIGSRRGGSFGSFLFALSSLSLSSLKHHLKERRKRQRKSRERLLQLIVMLSFSFRRSCIAPLPGVPFLPKERPAQKI